MALEKDTQHQMEGYLDGEMTQTERTEFESKISVQAELREALQFHQDMEELLSDSTENELRRNLQTIELQFEDAGEKKYTASGNLTHTISSRWSKLVAEFKQSIEDVRTKRLLISTSLVGTFVLVLAALVWYTNNNTTQPNNISDVSEKENIPTSKEEIVPDENKTSIPDQEDAIAEIENTSTPQQENSDPNQEKKNTPSITKEMEEEALLAGGNPFAQEEKSISDLVKPEEDVRDYFEPLALLEAMEKSSFEEEGLRIQITENLADSIFISAAKGNVYNFSVTINNQSTLPLNELRVYIYSNSEYHWEEQTPWFAYQPKIEKTGNNTYLLSSKIKPNLETGRYYCMLRNKVSQQIYTLTDFVIVEDK